MKDTYEVDMTKARRRKRRSRRNINRYYTVRYNAFIKSGFTEKEARWGAKNGLALRDPNIKIIRKHREALVNLYMGRHYGFSRERAIEMASKDLRSKLDKEGISETNLFLEVSP